MAVARSDGTRILLGADISGTSALERFGVKLYNNAGEERDNITLMHELGLNEARFRVWVNPRDGECDMHDVLAMANRTQAQGTAMIPDKKVRFKPDFLNIII